VTEGWNCLVAFSLLPLIDLGCRRYSWTGTTTAYRKAKLAGDAAFHKPNVHLGSNRLARRPLVARLRIHATVLRLSCECENAEFVRNGGVIYDGLKTSITRTTNGAFVKRDIELEDKMVVPNPQNEFLKISRKKYWRW
jgi:hypothetical protein